MANIQNRSPWFITSPKGEPIKFRTLKQAEAFLADHDIAKAKIRQGQTSFEVQIRLVDKEGNQIQQTKTFSTEDEAIKWANEEENRILGYKQETGAFNIALETMTFADALKRTVKEHYKGMASQDQNADRAEIIIDQLSAMRLSSTIKLKEITPTIIRNYRAYLIETEQYSASTVRNYFAFISQTFKHARSEWGFDIENPTKGIGLPKPNNAIERYWRSGQNERERLFESIDKHRPWLRPIVELSLEMSFRLGELVPRTRTEKHAHQGLMWEGVDLENSTIRLFREKNDHTKSPTEIRGRIVPMTPRMHEILTELAGDHKVRTGRVFNATNSTIDKAFRFCCAHAEPPITDLTFHSCRKIATVDLSKAVPNPMLLSKLTGHRDIQTLSERYYKTPIEDLKVMLAGHNIANPLVKGLLVLEKQLGTKEAEAFLQFVKGAKLRGKENLLKALKHKLEI